MNIKKKVISLALKFLILIVSLFIFFAMAEMVLRVKKDGKYSDPRFAYNKEWSKKFVTLNSHGFRDYEYSIEKPDDVFRIMVMGDSQTVGHGIEKLNDTWPKILESSLNEGFEKKKFEVINMANWGYNFDKFFYDTFERAFKFQPDIILIQVFFHNDVLTPRNHHCDYGQFIHWGSDFFEDLKTVNRFLNKSRLYQFFKFRLDQLLIKLGRKKSYADCLKERFDSRGWDMSMVYLNQIIKASKLKNVKIMLSILPVLYNLDDYEIYWAHEKLKNHCHAQQITCLDLFDHGLKGIDTHEIVVSSQDLHLNEKGLEVVGNEVYKKLSPLREFKHLSKIA
ncbi:MAG: SGNH/GDSL hydrolase family protein, partial [Nitrospinota bacterium]|nr:SGNH/GDSL hydrolase family protein [Nitrospinota bacterium]